WMHAAKHQYDRNPHVEQAMTCTCARSSAMSHLRQRRGEAETIEKTYGLTNPIRGRPLLLSETPNTSFEATRHFSRLCCNESQSSSNPFQRIPRARPEESVPAPLASSSR